MTIKIRSLTTSVKTLQRDAPANGNLNYAVEKSSVLSAKTAIRIALSYTFDHLPVTPTMLRYVSDASSKSVDGGTRPNFSD